jgi:hypothetical protein
MSTVFKSDYDSGAAFTCTLASLANNAARSSAAVDNSTNLYLDALVQMQIKSGTGTSASGTVLVYAYGTTDGGTTYPEGAGTDTGVTLTVPTNLKLIGTINVVADSTTYKSDPVSVAGAFGGILPQKWGIVVLNQSGAALDSTEGNHKKLYQGTWVQGV